MSNYEYLVNKFNQGELDEILGSIGDNIQALITLIDKKGLLEKIDLGSDYNGEYHNDVYFYISQNHTQYFLELMNDFFDEITIDEEGNVFLTLDNRGDLADLVCDSGRNNLSEDQVRSILDGESDPYYFDETTNDIYRDVIEDLSPKNLEFLFIKILEEIKEQNLEFIPETDLLKQIAENQGHEDYVEINENNIKEIFKDEDSVLSVLENMENIKSELYSVHERAYSDAYESEVYDDVMNGFDDFFIGSGDWETKPHPSNPDKTIYTYKIQVKDFLGLMRNYFNEVRNDDPNTTINNQGYFLNILKAGIEYGVFDCVRIYAPDYADWTKVKENINDSFQDYFLY